MAAAEVPDPWLVGLWALGPWLLVVMACALDRLVGDPVRWFHPVQAMGAAIAALRGVAERLCGRRPRALRLAGLLITLLLVGGSALAGWCLEALAFGHGGPWIRIPALLLLLGLASALAGRSLEQAVEAVLAALPDERLARRRLAGIVGRDVEGLDEAAILRACAETASENGVDGLFAPLFWMLVGAALLQGCWQAEWVLPLKPVPGPLALAWAFKASSTLDSMLGYRRGRLRWLGTGGARLDDLLTWLPCRLVALGLPWMVLRPGGPSSREAAGSGTGDNRPTAAMQGRWRLFREALRQGAADPSPNAGVSQAAYALVAGVRLGGLNHYGGVTRQKPLLAPDQPPPRSHDVARILQISRRLELAWLLVALLLLSAGPMLAGLPMLKGLRF